MKLHLVGCDAVYSIEQTAMILFPSLKPRYAPGSDSEGDRSVSTLFPDRAETRLRIGGREVTASVPYTLDESRRPEIYAIKTSFYRAALAFLPEKPVWGSLSGVRPAKSAAAVAPDGYEAVVRYLMSRYDVSRSKAALTAEAALFAHEVKKTLLPDDACLYVGIPFCPSRCRYCSFISKPGASPEELSAYVGALLKELSAIPATYGKRRYRAVYIGGGTPAILPAAEMERLLAAIRALVGDEPIEFTVEMGRPELITDEKLALLADFGVSKICVNPQSLSDDVLALAGRGHTTEQFYEAFRLARRYDFSINSDLIALLDGETPAGFLAGLEKLIALAPDAISVHSLAKKRTASIETVGGCGEVLQTLAAGETRLRDAGYAPYYLYRQKNTADATENVGWARPGGSSLYNVVMMEELGTVLSAGAGGVTKVFEGDQMLRRANVRNTDEYIRRMTAAIE